MDEWFARGHRVAIGGGPDQEPGRGAVHLFCRTTGTGPWITLLHGFPTCSWDWAPISERLAAEHTLLLPDLLGFGGSDKPRGHDYSIMEQADLVEGLWRHFSVGETGLVAHDIGGAVAQELLFRQESGRLSVRVPRVVFLNGALYESASRPRRFQRLMAQPIAGPVLARLMTERLFARNLAAVFSAAHPLSAEAAHLYWLAFISGGGPPHIHRLLAYIAERRRNHSRWEAALERCPAALTFIWGMADPVSGAPVAEQLRDRVPTANLQALADIGHYPHLEVPDLVASAVAEAFQTSPS